jgi:hypothetical protein
MFGQIVFFKFKIKKGDLKKHDVWSDFIHFANDDTCHVSCIFQIGNIKCVIRLYSSSSKYRLVVSIICGPIMI